MVYRLARGGISLPPSIFNLGTVQEGQPQGAMATTMTTARAMISRYVNGKTELSRWQDHLVDLGDKFRAVERKSSEIARLAKILEM